MSEERMVEAIQKALGTHGIEDEIVAAGQFNPRGHSGGLFLGGFAGSEVGGAFGGVGDSVGLAVGSIAGMDAADAASGLPGWMLIGVSATTVYGFAGRSRRKEPTDPGLPGSARRARGEGPPARERARARADRAGRQLADRARGEPNSGDALEGRDPRPASVKGRSGR